MDALPLISIVVPVYNVSDLIDRCVSSICSQTYRNLEIIIVDDGSTDDGGEKCDAWFSSDERVVVFHKENGGLSDARNYGIDRATGEYLMFVDSDDYIASNLVERLYDVMCLSGAGIAICDPVHVYGGDGVFTDDGQMMLYTAHDAIVEMLYQSSFLVSAWGKLYRMSCFSSLRFPSGKLFEDSAIMYRVFETVSHVAYTPAKLYAYCHRGDSITSRPFDSGDLDIWEISKEIEKHYDGASKEVVGAARSYRMSAALRIFLNAPIESFPNEVNECASWIREHSGQVARDHRVRRKTKIALRLFRMGRPFMRSLCGMVDRWA